MNAILVIAAVISALNINNQIIPESAKENKVSWELDNDFSDEFNGVTDINYVKWSKSSGLPNTTAWLWDNTSNLKVENGIVKLTMRHNANNEAVNNTYFKSGILQSTKKNIYGYYEARIKGSGIPAGLSQDPKGRGVCPSFWLWSFGSQTVNGELVTYSEIDAVELQQFDWYNNHQDDIRDMDLNLHTVVNGEWQRPKQFPDQQLNKWRANWDPSAGFHTYAVENRPDSIIWFVDGIRVAAKLNLYWHLPMNVTVSLGLRTPFVSFYNNKNNPINPLTDSRAKAKLDKMTNDTTSMFVDYIRTWKALPTVWINNSEKYITQNFNNSEPFSVNIGYHAGSGYKVMNGEWNGMTCKLVEFDELNNIVKEYTGTNNTVIGKCAGATTISINIQGATPTVNLGANHYYAIISSFRSSKNGGEDVNLIEPLKNIKITSNNTKIEDINSDNRFNIYPNPTKDYLNITFPEINNHSFIHIYNLSGILVDTKLATSRIDVQHLKAGTYIIKYKNNRVLFTKQ